MRPQASCHSARVYKKTYGPVRDEYNSNKNTDFVPWPTPVSFWARVQSGDHQLNFTIRGSVRGRGVFKNHPPEASARARARIYAHIRARMDS